MSGVRIEQGARVVLAWCSACPSWRELRADRGAVQLAAAAHLEHVHGDTRAAANLRELARRNAARHAGPSNNAP